MPVRITEIPGLQPTNPGLVNVDPNAAAAPARALGNVAQGIAQLGQAWQGIAEDAQRAENAATIYETRSNWRRGWADLETELAKDPDPQSRLRRTDEYLQGLRGTVDADGIAPAARQQLLGDLNQFADSIYLDSRASAARLTQEKARIGYRDAVETATSIPELKAAHDTAVASGVDLPESWPEMERNFEQKQRKDALIAQAIDTPDVFLEEHKERPADVDPVEWQQLQGTARSSLARVTGQAVDELQDGIAAGNITRPEQIDELAPELRPAAREQLKSDLARRADANFKAIQASPGYQASTVAKVEELLDGYRIDTDGYDVAYVQMDSLVRSLPEGSSARAELTRRLHESREGQERRLEDARDYHRAQLDDLRKAGIFGKHTTETDTRMYLDAGMLDNAKALRTYGFSEKQADAIAGLHGKRTEQLAEYRRLWHQRAEADKALSGTGAYRIAEAVASREQTIVTTDIAAKEKERRAYGNAKIKFEDWLKTNPTATEDQVRKKLVELAGSSANPQFIEEVISSPPVFDGIDIDGTLLPPPPEN